ncbi:MAG: transglycosylase SLT domain-containing protein [Eubacterium sp.]
MNTVNYITPSDGDIYLVNNQTYVNSGGTDFDKIYNNITRDDDSLRIFLPEQQKEFGINENFLKAVAQAESGFDPDIVSYCGAQGIMQLMPYRKAWCYGSFDARQNVYAGA